MKKVALLGGVKDTLRHAPFADASWAIWSHSSVALSAVRRVDRWFDLHPPHCFQEPIKCGRRYYDWLKGLTTPVYMQKHYGEIPASVRYPRERIQAEFPLVPFGSQTAWMIALALAEGYTHIGLYGIHYQHETEYFEQRANAELWVGVAIGRGVHVVIPEGTPLAREPRDLYGYESHTPEKYAERRQRFAEAKRRASRTTVAGLSGAHPGFDPGRLVPVAWTPGVGVQHGEEGAERPSGGGTERRPGELRGGTADGAGDDLRGRPGVGARLRAAAARLRAARGGGGGHAVAAPDARAGDAAGDGRGDQPDQVSAHRGDRE